MRAAATGISRRSFSSVSCDLRHVFTSVKVENGPSSQCLPTHNRVAMATCPWILFIPLQAVVILGTLTPGPRPGILFQQPRQSYPGVHGGDLKTAPAAQDSSAKGSLSPSQGPPSSQAASCPLDTKHHWRLLTKYWLNLGLSCSNLPENTDPVTDVFHSP